MDGKSENIQEHFKSIYETLYNSVDDSEELERINSEVNEKLNVSHLRNIFWRQRGVFSKVVLGFRNFGYDF